VVEGYWEENSLGVTVFYEVTMDDLKDIEQIYRQAGATLSLSERASLRRNITAALNPSRNSWIRLMALAATLVLIVATVIFYRYSSLPDKIGQVAGGMENVSLELNDENYYFDQVWGQDLSDWENSSSPISQETVQKVIASLMEGFASLTSDEDTFFEYLEEPEDIEPVLLALILDDTNNHNHLVKE